MGYTTERQPEGAAKSVEGFRNGRHYSRSSGN